MKLYELTKMPDKPVRGNSDFASFKHNIRTVLDKKMYFFRGADDLDFTLEPSYRFQYDIRKQRTSHRESQFGNDVLLLCASRWPDFPNRALSYFATQSEKHAAAFSSDEEAVLIIPADSVKVFAWSPGDFNQPGNSKSKKYLSRKNLQDLTGKITDLRFRLGGALVEKSTSTNMLRKMMKECGLEEFDPWPQSFEAYLKFFDLVMKNHSEISAQLRADTPRDAARGHLAETKTFLSNLGVVAMFAEELDINKFVDVPDHVTPQSMGIELSPTFEGLSAFEINQFETDEIWFEGDYLAVRWETGRVLDKLGRMLTLMEM